MSFRSHWHTCHIRLWLDIERCRHPFHRTRHQSHTCSHRQVSVCELACRRWDLSQMLRCSTLLSHRVCPWSTLLVAVVVIAGALIARHCWSSIPVCLLGDHGHCRCRVPRRWLAQESMALTLSLEVEETASSGKIMQAQDTTDWDRGCKRRKTGRGYGTANIRRDIGELSKFHL